MKEHTTVLDELAPLGRGVDVDAASSQVAADAGMEVREEQWATVTAQPLYQLRCECGRSWFELELPEFVKCPACHRLGLVSR